MDRGNLAERIRSLVLDLTVRHEVWNLYAGLAGLRGVPRGRAHVVSHPAVQTGRGQAVVVVVVVVYFVQGGGRGL